MVNVLHLQSSLSSKFLKKEKGTVFNSYVVNQICECHVNLTPENNALPLLEWDEKFEEIVLFCRRSSDVG